MFKKLINRNVLKEQDKREIEQPIRKRTFNRNGFRIKKDW